MMAERYRQEITEWSDSTPNHIYITNGRTLLGYVPRGTMKEHRFKTPSKCWSPSRRKFRDLTKKELLAIKESNK